MENFRSFIQLAAAKFIAKAGKAVRHWHMHRATFVSVQDPRPLTLARGMDYVASICASADPTYSDLFWQPDRKESSAKTGFSNAKRSGIQNKQDKC